MVFNKIIRNSQEKTAPESHVWCHIGDEISENREKKYTGLQGDMELSFAANLALN
jgi:hypothetical protein